MVYDYIFCGFGLSAVVLLDELLDSGLADRKNILIIENEWAHKDCKTWCFWEEGSGKWDFALAKTWTQAVFKNYDTEENCLKDGMLYKMIDAKKLFNYIHNRIAQHANIEICDEKVAVVTQLDHATRVTTVNNHYDGNVIFNSIFDRNIASHSEHPMLLQHFVGWYIKVNHSPFNPETAILMDFGIPQEGSTRFMYVLPISSSEFLVEFTLFSPELVTKEVYDTQLKAYLNKEGIGNYKIVKTETGIIPMTTFPFWKMNSNNILHIGSAGGWTKSSTGYTFNSARSKSKKLINFLANERVDFREFYRTNRFYLYDRLFIEVLFHRNNIGYQLFSSLFLKSNPTAVLRFLDEISCGTDELKVIMATPKKPFLMALLHVIFGISRK